MSRSTLHLLTTTLNSDFIKTNAMIDCQVDILSGLTCRLARVRARLELAASVPRDARAEHDDRGGGRLPDAADLPAPSARRPAVRPPRRPPRGRSLLHRRRPGRRGARARPLLLRPVALGRRRHRLPHRDGAPPLRRRHSLPAGGNAASEK